MLLESILIKVGQNNMLINQNHQLSTKHVVLNSPIFPFYHSWFDTSVFFNITGKLLNCLPETETL